MSKLRVAWFSELNLDGDSSSCSAYTTEELLPHLSERMEIELFHDKFSSHSTLPTFHYLTAAKRHSEKPYDIFFYQLEDRKESYFVRSHVGIKPGVVLFHDLLLKQDGPEPFHYSPWQNVVEKLNDAGKSWPKRGTFPDRLGPLAYREGAFSIVPLFSNSRNLGEFRREVKVSALSNQESESPRSFYLPIPVSELALSENKSEELQIGFCAGPDIEYRAHKVLPALSELAKERELKLHWLIDEREESRIKELLSEFGFKNVELHLGRSPRAWQKLAASMDLALHPLFSVFGDPSAYVAVSLMRGLPVLLTEFAASESFQTRSL